MFWELLCRMMVMMKLDCGGCFHQIGVRLTGERLKAA